MTIKTFTYAQRATWTDASGTHQVQVLSPADASGHHKVLDLDNHGTWRAHRSQLELH